MVNKKPLIDFTLYIEDLCKSHTLIKHRPTEKHFVRLAKDELLQETRALVFYPVVTMESLTNSYTSLEDSFRKSRHLELMFLDHVGDIGDFDSIEKVWDDMESIAEDFIRKIRVDKRDRKKYPFLQSLNMTSVELDRVENVQTHLWGVLLSFDLDLPFDNCIDAGRFE